MKKLTFLLTILILTLTTIDFARSSTWEKTFGGEGFDGGTSVAITADGGYIITGGTDSFGLASHDILLIKTDSDGNQEWQKTYSGSGNYSDVGTCVAQTSDGGYIITGTYGAGFVSNLCLIKTDSDGNKVWDRTFVGSGQGNSVVQTLDGGYILVGSIGSDVWVIKTNSAGVGQWNRTYGGGGSDYGESIAQTTDGGYIIAGYTDSFGAGYQDVWLIKIDDFGDEEWSKTFGGTSSDRGYSVIQTLDHGYVIAGETKSYSGTSYFDFWLIKTDINGNEEWNHTYGGSLSESGRSVAQHTDGSYVIAGYTNSFGSGENDVYIVKAAPDGEEICSYIIGGVNDDEVYSVAITLDDAYIAAGTTYSYGAGACDVWLIYCYCSEYSSPISFRGIAAYLGIIIFIVGIITVLRSKRRENKIFKRNNTTL